MKASQLAKELNKLIARHGDMNFVIESHCDSGTYEPGIEILEEIIHLNNGKDTGKRRKVICAR